MGALASDYFTKLFSSEETSLSPDEEETIFGGQFKQISRIQNQMLTKEVTLGEVKRIVFELGGDKSPGPDGLSGRFYQQFWEDIGGEVFKVVQCFMQSGFLDSRLNETLICLNPKKTHPHRLSEFRPISLCNFIYKVISKVLSTRLKEVLDNIISENQAAFIKGRLISDNILLAHELSHSLRTVDKVAKGFCALKTDMTKAFDRIEWPFFERVLRTFGFDAIWIQRIMACVTTVSYGVLINGKAHGSIAPSRGLRQGDPLSPFLFIICAEMLAHGMKLAEEKGKITGIQFSERGPSISHLLFADDSLFFCKASKAEFQGISKVLQAYEKCSGQKINLAKSSITFGSKISTRVKDELKHSIGITAEGGKGIYLGLPEAFIGSKCNTLNFLEKRIRNRISS